MKVDGGIGFDLAKAAATAEEAEDAGYDGIWSAETSHDPFFPLLLAAEHTERVELGTGIAVAFPRSPMHLANLGWDLQAFSKGRFLLGLGTQFQISCPTFVVTGTTEQEMATADQGVRQQIAFYASTPAYKPVLDKHGWGDLQPELNRLSKQGEWVEMGNLISDEIVATFAVIGEPEEIPKLILDRYGDVIDRVTFYAPYRSDPERWKNVLAGFKTGV